MKYALIILFTLVAVARLEAHSFKSPTQDLNFSKMAVPEDWIPAKVQPPQKDSQLFQKLNERDEFQDKGLLITHFIHRFGLPSAYMVSKDKKKDIWNYLVYDLPSKETVILYVSQPPSKYFGAAAAFDAKGKLLRLIK